jgi:hypothetical protein
MAGSAAASAPTSNSNMPLALTAVETAAARGQIFKGLRSTGPDDRCHGVFALVTSGECTHGPDPAPAGIDVRTPRAVTANDTSSGGSTAQGAAAVPCYGNGSDGKRVQVIYAHAADVSDRYGQVVGALRTYAATADTVYNNSAAETGAVRHVRWVTDSSCNLVVADVQLSTAGDDSIDNTINELRSKGYNRTDRKYLVWMDATVYCGIAQVYGDDKPTQDNTSNGSSQVPGEFARVDSGCWGVSGQSIEAHELMHTFGGVQTTAPHATRYNHCYDTADRMCYDDGSGTPMQAVCGSSHANLFDCNHDDYFYAGTPPPTNYLANHWNTANSSFLATTVPVPAGPPQSTGGAVTAGGYIVDDWSGIHPVAEGSGNLPPPTWGGPYWPAQDVVRGISLLSGGTGGYIVDDWSGIHPFAVNGGTLPGPVSGGPYWPGQDVVRGIALLPNGTSGYVLDSWGGVHPFGGAPGVRVTGYWQGQDVARGIALLPNGTGGYVADAWGGMHPFAVGNNAFPAATTAGPYWPGVDAVRGATVVASATGGYIVDSWGGVHRFAVGANALPPATTGGPYWAGQDVVRGITAL